MIDTPYANFDDLVAHDPDDDAEDIELPSGLLVRVRGLTRYELIFNGKGAEKDTLLVEARNVASCLITPNLTVGQVQQWQRRSSAGGDFKALSERIRDLSGLGEGADKSDPGEPGE